MVSPDIYRDNLQLLTRHHPHLVEVVEQARSLQAELIPTRSGSWTLTVADEAGNRKLRHSKYNPEEAARRLLDTADLSALNVFRVYGLGLGYELQELMRRLKPNSGVLVFEPSPDLFRTWLEIADRREILTHVNVRIYVALQPNDLYDKLRNDITRVFAAPKFEAIAPPEALDIWPSYFQALGKAIGEYVKVGAFMMRTGFMLARTNLMNRMGNIVRYAAGEGVEFYKDRFQGRAGVCVMAGPSLAKNIHLLKEIKGRAPIISVSATFKILLDHGIVPDFTTHLDYQRLTRNFFIDVDPALQVPLVADPKGSYHTFSEYPGPVVFYRDDWMEKLQDAGGPIRHADAIQSGGTVAHLAFSLARYLGCDPIILLGQDLAYSDGLTHIPGTLYFSWWRAETNRFMTYETIEWKYVRREIEKLIPMKDWQGNPIYTTEFYMTYGRELEAMIGETKAKVIDATEGGAIIKGTELMTFRQAIDTHVGPPLAPEFFAKPAVTPAERRERLIFCRDQLRQRLDEGAGLVKLIDASLDLTKRIENRLRQHKPIEHLIPELQRVNPKLDRHPRLMEAISVLMIADERERQIADARVVAEGLKGLKRQEAQLERDRRYLFGFRNAYKEFEKWARFALERLDRALEELP